MGESPPFCHWQSWYRICALAGCSDTERARLGAFAHSRFLTYLRRLGGGDIDPGLLTAPERAWHLFETHLQLKATRQGKRYKDWLFARIDGSGDDPARVVEAGASLIMRSVVREYVRAERPRARTASLDAVLSDEFGHALTLDDLLAGPCDTAGEVMARERAALARRSAAAAFDGLDRRARVILAAKGLGVSLAHSTVERLAGARKSVLCEQYRQWVADVAEGLRSGTAADHEGGRVGVALQTIQYAQTLAVAWARSEKRCAALFRCVGG